MTLRKFHIGALAAYYRRNPRWGRTGYSENDTIKFAAWWRWQVRGIA